MNDETIICGFCNKEVTDPPSMYIDKFCHKECMETMGEGGFETKKELDDTMQVKIEKEQKEIKRKKHVRAGTLESF